MVCAKARNSDRSARTSGKDGDLNVRTRLRHRLIALAAGLSVSTAAGQDPTVSLKAVRVNGTPIARTNALSAEAGDIIECEIFISDWSPLGQKLIAFHAVIRRESFLSGIGGQLTQLGWDRPPIPKLDYTCSTDADCPSEFPICLPEGICVGPNYDPSQGAFIVRNRPDWVFWCDPPSLSCPGFDAPQPGTNPLRYSDVLILAADAQMYTSPEKYAGTLILEVSDDACGIFTLSFDLPGTSLWDINAILIEPLTLEPLVIDTASPPCGIVGINPPNCAIDPGQPTHPNGSELMAWNTVQVTFQADVSSAALEDFTVCESGEPPPVTIEELILPSEPGNTVTLRLSHNIPTAQWTCICYLPRGEKACVAALPGDVNGDGFSGPQDVTALVDCIANTGSCEEWRCDIDRSGSCRPADILREIDLLNGAAAFDAWLGESLPPCPSPP